MPLEFHIETHRLILREFRDGDEQGIFRLDSNPIVHTYLGNRPISTLEQAKAVVGLVKQQYVELGIGRWAVIEKSTQEFIGWSGIKHVIQPEHGTETYYDIGYRFIPEAWGKGYATESALEGLQYGFETLNVPLIIGTAHVENKASRRVLEKIGLHYKKTMFSPITDRDIDWLEMTTDEWVGKNR